MASVQVTLDCTPQWWATASDVSRAAALLALMDLGADINANDKTITASFHLPEDLEVDFNASRDAIRLRIISLLTRPD